MPCTGKRSGPVFFDRYRIENIVLRVTVEHLDICTGLKEDSHCIRLGALTLLCPQKLTFPATVQFGSSTARSFGCTHNL